MTETVTIEVQADVKSAQQGMAELRDDLKKTKKEGQAVGTSFGEISRGLGSISPQLGRVTQSLGRLTDQMKKLGVQTGSNGAFGRMTSGLGRLTSSSGFRKGVGILGLGVAAGGILSSLMGGGGNNKLAGFDQLNAMGQETLIDFLSRQFKQLNTDSLKPIADATTVVAENSTKLLELYRLANPDIAGDTEKTPDNLPDQIVKIEEDGQKERSEQNDKGWKTVNNTIFDQMSKMTTTMTSFWSSFLSSATRGGESGSSTGLDKLAEDVAEDIKNDSTTASKSLLEKGNDLLKGATNLLTKVTSTIWGGEMKSATATAKEGSGVLGQLAAGVVNSKSLSSIGSTLALTPAALGAGASAISSVAGKAGNVLGSLAKGLGSLFGFAEGGLFMPNQPQLAILGDNKTEPEVAAPRSMIVDAVREAVSTSGSATTMSDRSSQPIHITLEIDGKTLARILYDPMNNETVRRNGGVR